VQKNKNIAKLLVVAILFLAIPVAVFFNQQKQELRQHAAGQNARFGINVEPSYRPWHWSGGQNPDSWWDPQTGQAKIDAEMPAISRLGVQYVRLEYPWTFLEPTKGIYDWSRADYIMTAANKYGLQIQPIIVFCPSWEGSPTCVPNPTDFSTFVKALVTRYHSSIHYWEMWNETTDSHVHYFGGNEQQYIQNILNPGYNAVKAVDPSGQVMFSGQYNTTQGWIDGLFSNGAKFDIAAYHDYSGSAATANSMARTIQGWLSNHNFQGPLWLGEFGSQENTTNDNNQQAYFTGVMQQGANPSSVIMWYNLRDDNIYDNQTTIAHGDYYGLMQHDLTQKQGYSVFKSLTGGMSLSPTPSSITPTYFCLAGQQCTSPNPTVTLGPTTSSDSPTPSSSLTSSPNPQPCTVSSAADAEESKHKKHRSHRHTGTRGLINQLLRLIIELLNLLIRLLGGNPIILPPVPTPTPTPGIELSPTPNPIDSPIPTPNLSSAPTASPNPCPPTTQPSPSNTGSPSVAPTITQIPPPNGTLAIRVSGNHLVDGSGNAVVLRGVNISGTEFTCAQNWTTDPYGGAPLGSVSTFQAMQVWHIHIVRIPMNEDCWLNINGVEVGGTAYQQAIAKEVAAAHSAGMYVILDLHWSAPGTQRALSQNPAPDKDHSPTFWQQVATAYKNDPAVIFDLYNEPYDYWGTNPDHWAGWLNGDTQTQYVTGGQPYSVNVSWQTAGMQELVNVIRATGAIQPILVNGLDWSNDDSGWLAHAPVDPQHQIIAGAHLYQGEACSTTSCWDGVFPALEAQYPVLIGETGDHSATAVSFLPTFFSYADSYKWNYLAWTWNPWSDGNNVLIKDWNGSPTDGEGVAWKTHLLLH